MLSLLSIPTILGITVILCATFLLSLKRRYMYWISKGVIQLKPKLFIGDLSFEQNVDVTYQKHYNKFKAKGLKFGGIYTFWKPTLMILDPDLIKQILIKDFDFFVNRGQNRLNDKDPLSGMLVFLEDGQWKDMRSKLTPTFTSGKMKMMFDTFVECSEAFKDLLNSCAESKDATDIKDVLKKFTMEIIGSCAFGLDLNTMKNPNSEITHVMKLAFKPSYLKRYMRIIVPLLPMALVRFLNLHVAPQIVESFFVNLVNEMVQYREANNIFRKDFMHSMIQLKNRGKVADDEQIKDGEGSTKHFLKIEEIYAQCFVFFMAGFETSSTTMTFALYELAVNQDEQENLRLEIEVVLKKYNGKLTYDAVADMHYLDQVVKETLRLHPPAGHLTRQCNKDYKLPNSNITLEKGTLINVALLGLHMDKEYYPNPEKFDPERFNAENNAKRPGCTWLPFGEGPRNCIGLRFGLLQTKVGLITVLRDFKITINERTKTPLELDNGAAVRTVLGGMWLNVEKIIDK